MKKGFALTSVVVLGCGCGSTDPSRVDYSGSVAMNVFVVLVVLVLCGVGWLASKISGGDK